MLKIIVKRSMTCLCLFISTLALVSCSTLNVFSHTARPDDPVTLKPIKSKNEFKVVWHRYVGTQSDKNHLSFLPAVKQSVVYVVSPEGELQSLDALTGKTRWHKSIASAVTTGPVVVGKTLYVGLSDSHLNAYQTTDGQLLWSLELPNQIIAPPAGNQRWLVVKTIDDTLLGIDARLGKIRWQVLHAAPELMLRGASAPLISGKQVIVGFADGELGAYDLHSGRSRWTHRVAVPQGSFPVQRLVDIVAQPVIDSDRIYTVSFQGQLTALSNYHGSLIWQHAMSALNGICVSGDRVFVTDTTSRVWAFDKDTGRVVWHQDQLRYRQLSAPISVGDSVIVGDLDGYLHGLSKQDGGFVARLHVGRGPFAKQFQVIDNSHWIASTKTGYLMAITQVAHS